jgi:hypothetical protein
LNLKKIKNNNYLINEKSLVSWGNNLGSTTGTKYTKYVLSIINLPNDIKSIMVEIILSDSHIAFNFKGKNAYLILNQSLAKSAYVYFVFSFLNHYCQSYPKLSVSYGLGRPSYILRIATRSMPCITELYNNCYLNNNYKTSYIFWFYAYCIGPFNYGGVVVLMVKIYYYALIHLK